MYKAEIFKVYL